MYRKGRVLLNLILLYLRIETITYGTVQLNQRRPLVCAKNPQRDILKIAVRSGGTPDKFEAEWLCLLPAETYSMHVVVLWLS